MFGTNRPTPAETHVELVVPPAVYESLQKGGVDISEHIPSLLAVILSAALGSSRGSARQVEISLSL